MPPIKGAVVICLKIRTFVVSATTCTWYLVPINMLWFAWKFVPLWYQQQLYWGGTTVTSCCDLLENSYLCGISNNARENNTFKRLVVICLKIRTFVVSATTYQSKIRIGRLLWFAWKFVPLWYQQQQIGDFSVINLCCDLLENSYLCGISNNYSVDYYCFVPVVICLKIRTFVVSATTNIRCYHLMT